MIEVTSPAITAAITNKGFQISTTTIAMMKPIDNTAALLPHTIRVAAKIVSLICSQRAAKVPLVRTYSRTPKATSPIRTTTIQIPASPNASFACPQAAAARGGASPG